MCQQVCSGVHAAAGGGPGVYEQLLARRGPLLEDAVPGAGVVLGPGGDDSSRKALRLRMLTSVAAHCSIVLREEVGSGTSGQVSGRDMCCADVL